MRSTFEGLRQSDIAALVGTSTSTVQKFMNGKHGSMVIAHYMAEHYGGEYATLLAEHLDMLNVEPIIDKYSDYPSPSAVIEMPVPLHETHHLQQYKSLWPAPERKK